MNAGDLYIGNSMVVHLVGMKVDGAYLNDATCTASIRDADGLLVTGAESIEMAYSGTPGSYRGVFPADLPLTVDARYTIEARAAKDGVGAGRWRIERIAQYRTGNCGC